MSDNFLLNMGKSSEGDVLDDAVATEVVDASFDLTTSEADSDVDVDEAEVESIFSKPGQWYVVHSQSGYEKKVELNLKSRISSMQMEHRQYMYNSLLTSTARRPRTYQDGQRRCQLMAHASQSAPPTTTAAD